MRKERENIMLAYPATQRKIDKFPQPFYAQPKLNGTRCRVEWFKGTPILISAFQNEFMFLPQIQADLMNLPPLPYDGELYVHGWPRERIHSAVSQKKKPNADSSKVELHIFDYQSQVAKQNSRIDILSDAMRELNYVKPVITVYANSENWLEYCKLFVQAAIPYEGIIARNPNGHYSMKRSTDLLKYKPTFHDTYKIVGIQEAVSIPPDCQPLNMVGAFIVKSPTHKQQFKVGAGKLSHSERKAIWARHKQQNDIIGKNLLVKHEQLKTVNDIPLCCVAVSLEGV